MSQSITSTLINKTCTLLVLGGTTSATIISDPYLKPIELEDIDQNNLNGQRGFMGHNSNPMYSPLANYGPSIKLHVLVLLPDGKTKEVPLQNIIIKNDEEKSDSSNFDMKEPYPLMSYTIRFTVQLLLKDTQCENFKLGSVIDYHYTVMASTMAEAIGKAFMEHNGTTEIGKASIIVFTEHVNL